MTDSIILPDYLQKLWLVHTMARDKALLNIGADVVIRGPYSPDLIQSAFSSAAEEHDAFHLLFKIGSSGPECHRRENTVPPFRIVDLGDFGDDDPDHIHGEIAKYESEPLSPEDGLLLRGTLYILGRSIAILSVTAHHLVADAWTIRIFVQDVLHHWRQLKGEENPDRPPAGGFFKFLANTPSSTPEMSRMCAAQSMFVLPTDREIKPENRGNAGAEVGILLKGSEYKRFCHQCSETGQTHFAGIVGIIATLIAGESGKNTVEAGILITTRNLRTQRRTAGCFVQAMSVSLDVKNGATVSQLIKDAGAAIREAWSRAKSGQPETRSRFPLMISMVRDSSANLVGPSGVSVRFERRRRTYAECDLHVFVYEHEDDIEIVFNYSTDVLTESTVETWATALVQIFNRTQDGLDIQAVPDSPTEAPPTTEAPFLCRLQHIGIAAWELDIGLRRLASVGIKPCGKPWENSKEGVVMALTGNPDTTQYEVVSPVRDGAPCVGSLVRDGEGPYHCCFRIESTSRMLDKMQELRITYNVITCEGRSQLFPDEKITFIIVDGFGLVEFLEGENLVVARDDSRSLDPELRIEIYSNNTNNARNFVSLIAEETDDTNRGSFYAKPIGGGICSVAIIPSSSSESQMIVEAVTVPMKDTFIHNYDSTQEYSTRWWSRVML